MNQDHILRCTPEEAGVPSGAVVEFFETLKAKGIAMHSVLLARNGKIFTEGYYAPWNASMNHRMFSQTKSLVSLAIGCLQNEGKLQLDDTIVSYFPEYVPAHPHPFLMEMTIRHMLTMRTCHMTTTYKKDLTKNWVESFFTTIPDHKPGTIFNYDTSSTHTLCALVEKLTGKKLLEYLREKCLDEIGFSKEAYIIPDPFGVSMGGSGLMALPMDMMRLGMLIMNHGRWNDKQLIPEEYLNEATALQVPTIAKGPIPEESQGYGYQFWKLSRDGYVMYGMGGQLVICLPKYQLICVTTADTMRRSGGNQVIYDSLYETILAALENKKTFSSCTQEELKRYVSHLTLEAAKGKDKPHNTELIGQIQGATYQITHAASLIQKVRFEFQEEKQEGSIFFEGEQGKFQLPFGLCKNKECIFPFYDQACVSSASWLCDDSFYLWAELMGEDIGGYWLQAVFQGDTVTLFMNRTIEYCTSELSGFLSGVKIS